MTKEVYFLPMPKHRIFILAYEGCQLLDVTGPAAVFGAANESRGQPFYDLSIVSPDGGAVTSNAGVAIQSRKIGGQPDTLLVAGGSRGLKAAMARDDLRRWLRTVAPKARRFGSVCTGAFVLAAAGLLDGKRVATHWASCERLARNVSCPRGRRRFALRRRRQDLDVGRKSRPASTWRWPWSRPTSARPRRT